MSRVKIPKKYNKFKIIDTNECFYDKLYIVANKETGLMFSLPEKKKYAFKLKGHANIYLKSLGILAEEHNLIVKEIDLNNVS